MKKLNIMQVAYKSEITGGEMVMLGLIKALKDKGHNVTAVVPGSGNFPDLLKEMGVPVDYVKFSKTWDIPGMLRLASVIRKRKPDILHTHGMIPNILGRMAGRISGVSASFSTIHLTYEFWKGGRVNSFKERSKVIYYTILDNFTSIFNDRIFAVSRYVRNDKLLQGVSPRKLRIVENGIDLKNPALDKKEKNTLLESFGINPENRVIGTISRLSPQKDIKTLLNGFRLLKDNGYKDLHCLIAGDGPLREELENHARDLGVDDSVIFTGYVDNASRLISCMDVFCLTSLWEGLPIVILEAMALGTPIVATCVPGTVEALGNTGLIIPMSNADELSAAVDKMLSDEVLANTMKSKAKMRVERRFSRNVMARNTEKHYKAVLRRKGVI